MANNISKTYRTFSGTDSLVFLMLPYSAPVCLGSITTISYSVSRDKRPVPLIGRINVGGFTRGTRIVAGTMIFTMVNQHWVNDLAKEIPWLESYGKIKADELPLLDIMIVSANEYGASIQMFIYGVDVTDEGQVLSVEDLFTENQFSFVARDIDTFNGDMFNNDKKLKNQPRIRGVGDLTFDKALNPDAFLSDRYGPERNLKLDSGNLISGDDVLDIQKHLNSKGVNVPLNGVYDNRTYEGVKKFQSKNGLPITGAIDDKTYEVLTDRRKKEGKITGLVISKSGANVYESPDLSSTPIKHHEYKETVEIVAITGDQWVQVTDGYILNYQIYGDNNDLLSAGFKELRYKDKGPLVTMVQESLDEIGYGPIYVSGWMDEDTIIKVKQFQKDNRLSEDGIVTTETWLLLQEKSDSISPDLIMKDYGFDIYYKKLPQTYDLDMTRFKLEEFGMTLKNFRRDVSVKITAVSHYPDSQVEEYSKTITGLKRDLPKEVTPVLLEDAFMYNARYKSEPDYVEFIFNPPSNKSFKWSFKLK